MSFRYWLGEKVVSAAVDKIATLYVHKLILTPKKLFRKPKSHLLPYEAKTLAILKRVKIHQGYGRIPTKKAIDTVKNSISELLRHDIMADQRKFGISFLMHYTDEMTLEEIMTALQGVDPQTLVAIIKAIAHEMMNEETIRLISTRDVLAHVATGIENEWRAIFKDAKLLRGWLNRSSDMTMCDKDISLIIGDHLEYDGLDSLPMSGSPELGKMREVQQEMKRIGTLISRQNCSKRHIVMSAALGEGWTMADTAAKKHMVISSANTDKTNLLIPSQTTVVCKEGDKWIYYGDVSVPPSTELASHWRMHELLGQAGKPWTNLRAILHAHLVDLMRLSVTHQDKREIAVGNTTVPNIDWLPYATPKLGKKIIKAMIEHKSRIAFVKDHGPWFVNRTLGDCYKEALDTIHDVTTMRSSG